MRTEVFVAVLLVGLVTGPLAAGAASAPQHADLAVQQPAYVDDGVAESQQDTRSIYRVQGERILLNPQNFDSERVVEYGLTTDAGSLRYDESLGLWVFSPEGNTGTFDMYWVVTQPIQVSRNNTTTTVMRQQRYQATLKVTGQAQLRHVAPGSLAATRAAAQKWRDWNATLQTLRQKNLLLQPDTVTTETLLQTMVNTYVTTRDPIQALLGGTFTSVGLLYVTSIGGAVWLVLWLAIPISLSRKLRKRLNIHESTEAAEGAITEKLADIDEAERKRVLQNMDWEDIFDDDHVAAAFRDAMGETVYDGYQRLSGILQPELLVRDRLEAMAQVGYVAIVERDDDGTIVDAAVAHEDDVADGDATASLADPDEDVLAALDWDSATIQEFDLVGSDYDPTDVDVVPESLDLTELLADVDVQLDRFEDETVVAAYLQEFVAAVRQHPYTDDDGRPETMRDILNQWLQVAQLQRDKFAIPLARMQAEHIERALVDYDPGEQAERLVSEVREGQHGD